MLTDRTATNFGHRRERSSEAVTTPAIKRVTSTDTQSQLKNEKPILRSEFVEALNPLLIPALRDAVCQGLPLDAQTAGRVVDLKPLRAIAGIVALNLSGMPITSLQDVCHLSRVRALNLSGTKISNVAMLAGFGELEELDISYTDVSDLNSLALLCKLRVVYADYTPVSDVTGLLRSPSLKELYIRRTKVDTAKLKPLRDDMLVFVD
ncbi:MAG: hypothetical protein WCA81_07085 [Rhizomicrobium sp.]